MLNSKKRTLFSSSLPVMWCKSVRWVHNCILDQSYLTHIEPQRQFPTVIYWLTCRRVQTIDYAILQTVEPCHQNFSSRTDWHMQSFWTMNIQNFSTLRLFQWFSRKCKSLSLQSCPKEFIRFLCEGIVNLLKRNLESIKRHHVAKFPK